MRMTAQSESCCLTVCTTSRPDTSGIFKSMIARWMSFLRSSSSTFRPSVSVTTRYPSFLRIFSTRSTESWSSSTTRIRMSTVAPFVATSSGVAFLRQLVPIWRRRSGQRTGCRTSGHPAKRTQPEDGDHRRYDKNDDGNGRASHRAVRSVVAFRGARGRLVLPPGRGPLVGRTALHDQVVPADLDQLAVVNRPPPVDALTVDANPGEAAQIFEMHLAIPPGEPGMPPRDVLPRQPDGVLLRAADGQLFPEERDDGPMAFVVLEDQLHREVPARLSDCSPPALRHFDAG